MPNKTTKIVIDDTPIKKRVVPNSFLLKHSPPNSPERRREKKIKTYRNRKESYARDFVIEPQFGNADRVRYAQYLNVAGFNPSGVDLSQAPPANSGLERAERRHASFLDACTSALERDQERLNYISYLSYRLSLVNEDRNPIDFLYALHRAYPQYTTEDDIREAFVNYTTDNGLLGEELVEEPSVQPQMGLFSLLTAPTSVDYEKIDNFTEAVKGLSSMTHTVDDKTRSVLEEVSDKFANSFDNLSAILMVLAIVFVMRPRTAREKVLVGFIILGYVSSRGAIADIWKNSTLFKWLSTPPGSDVVPQSFSVDQIATLGVGLLNTYMVAGLGKDLFKPRELSKVIGSISRTEGSIATITKAVHLLMSYVHASIDHFYNGKPWFLPCGHAFVDEFLREASVIVSLSENQKLPDLQSSLERVSACIVLGESIVLKIPGSQDTVGIRITVSNTLSELRKIKKALLASNFKFAGIRAEPIALLLRGPPGVGKSQSMQHIAHAISALTLNEDEFPLYKENPGTSIYNRAAENVYWDGYKQSMNVVFFDDILQARDIQGNPDNEAMNIIRGVNIFEYPLHCAEMSMKGNTNFRSNFVIANTNARTFKLESINEVGAFTRRWHIVVDVIPKKEFCVDPGLDDWNRRLDYSRLPKFTEADMGGNEKFRHLVGETKFDPNMCEYHLQRLSPDGRTFFPAGEILEFKQIVCLYYEKFMMKQRHQEIYTLKLDETLSDWRKQREIFASADDSSPSADEDFKLSDDDDLVLESISPHFPAASSAPDEFPSNDLVHEVNELVWRLEPSRRKVYWDLRYDNYKAFCIFEALFLQAMVSCHVLDISFTVDQVFDRVHQLMIECRMDEAHLTSRFKTNSLAKFYVVAVKEIVTTEFVVDENEIHEEIKTSLSRLEKLKILWKDTPSWSTWLYRIYQCTFAHFVRYGYNALKGAGEFIIYNVPLFCKNEFAPLVPVVKRFVYIYAFTRIFLWAITPSPKKTKKAVKEVVKKKVDDSTDPQVVDARSKMDEAQRAYDAEVERFKRATSHIEAEVLNEELEQTSPESDERSNRVKISRKPLRNRVRSSKVSPHGIAGTNLNLVGTMESVAKHNIMRIFVPVDLKPNLYAMNGYTMIVSGRVMMMPYHFLSVISARLEEGSLKSDDLIVFKRVGSDAVDLKLTVDELLDSHLEYEPAEKRDIAMVALPFTYRCVRSCVSKFATEEQLSLYSKVDAVLHIPGPKLNQEFHNLIANRRESTTITHEDWESYTVQDVFDYRAHVSPGDCGSILYVNDKFKSRCIIGIHVAGTGNSMGFSCALSQEFIKSYVDLFPDNVKNESDCSKDVLKIVDDNDVVMPNMIPFTLKPDQPYPRVSGKTKIVPSHIHGKVSEVLKFPARLKPFLKDGEVIDPMALVRSKYCKEDQYIDPIMLNESVEGFQSWLFHVSTIHVKPEVYTPELAVTGDQSGWFSCIPRSTSSGYPWNSMPIDSSKTYFFGPGPEWDFDRKQWQDLKTTVLIKLRGLIEGKRPRFIYSDFLKDERRSKKKVENGETRMISACPIDLLILFRMYFGAFQKWIVANRVHNGIAIGIDEKSPEWDFVARKLNKFGSDIPNKGAGDYEGFDMRHPNAVSWSILSLINYWYGNDCINSNRVRRMLWLEIVNSYHVYGFNVFEWLTALPSGAPPTATFNCIANHIYFRMCWHTIMSTISPTPSFDENVYLIVLGDDNVFSVSPTYATVFNELSISPVMASFGHNYTPEDKELIGHKVSLRMIEEVTFLKRNFIYSPTFGRYVAPLDVNSILDMLQWQKDSSNSYGDCEVLIVTALEELVFHGQNVYNKWASRIFDAIDSTDGLDRPLASSYLQNVKILKERYGALYECPISFDSDYHEDLNPKPVKEEFGGFIEERGGLFSLTTRKPRWQPHSISGTRRNSERPIQRSVLKRIANPTNSTVNTITDNVALGQTREGLFETSRGTAEKSEQNVVTTGSTVDADTPITSLTSYTPLSPALLDSAKTLPSQDVATFLAKPIIIAAGSFATTDTFSTFVYTNDGIPQSLLYAIPLWLSKILGNGAFRAELHLSLQCNATRFQTGRYILGWVPSGGSSQYVKIRKQHVPSLTHATQVPHVEIDVNCDTEATLIIPHVTCSGWASINSTAATYVGQNGSIFIAAYEGLGASTGSPNATWTLFAHWEKVELAMPVQPQSRSGARTKVKRKIAFQTVEQDSQNIGPLSSGLASISKASYALSGIPFLSAVAGPVGWATEVASAVAKSFGWSRPHNAEAPRVGQPFIVPRLTNMDTCDQSTVLAASDSNQVEELPGFAGSDLDEMSLSYLTSISAYFKKFTWTTAMAQGTSPVSATNMDPRSYYTTGTYAGTTTYNLAPISFFSSFFSMYRGSIRLTFKMVKTEFHSGRLLVGFRPYNPAVGNYPTSTLGSSAYEHRQIIDIRLGTEFTLEFPYMSVEAYRPTGGNDAIYGFVYVYVLNSLEAPANVPQSIVVLMEVSAGPDFELAGPCDMSGTPTQVVTPQMGSRNVCEIFSAPVGNARKGQETDLFARTCIGERILSMRQLAKRFSHYISNDGTIPNAFHRLFPYHSDVSFLDGTGYYNSFKAVDIYTWLQCCYALQRGGVRIKLIPRSEDPLRIMSVAHTYTNAASNILSTESWAANANSWMTSFPGNNKSCGIFAPSANGGVEVQLPYYSRTPATPCADLLVASSVITDAFISNPGNYAPRCALVTNFPAMTTSSTKPWLMRAISEDCSFGMFISTPVVVGYSVNYTG